MDSLQVAGFDEHGNKFLDSIQMWEIYKIAEF
jgi:hypothetical protein